MQLAFYNPYYQNATRAYLSVVLSLSLFLSFPSITQKALMMMMIKKHLIVLLSSSLLVFLFEFVVFGITS